MHVTMVTLCMTISGSYSYNSMVRSYIGMHEGSLLRMYILSMHACHIIRIYSCIHAGASIDGCITISKPCHIKLSAW